MRTTDDLQDSEKFKPLGSPILKPVAPVAPAKPQGASGIVTQDGKMQTTSHKPYVGMELDEAIWSWHKVYSDDAGIDFE